MTRKAVGTSATQVFGGGIGIHVVGAEDVGRNLMQLEPRLQKMLARRAMKRAMTVVEHEARMRAPYEHGATIGSIRQVPLKRLKRFKHTIGRQVITGGEEKGGLEPWYAKFQELGSKFIDATASAFLKPALVNNESKIKAIFISAMRAEIHKKMTGDRTSVTKLLNRYD